MFRHFEHVNFFAIAGEKGGDRGREGGEDRTWQDLDGEHPFDVVFPILCY